MFEPIDSTTLTSKPTHSTPTTPRPFTVNILALSTFTQLAFDSLKIQPKPCECFVGMFRHLISFVQGGWCGSTKSVEDMRSLRKMKFEGMVRRERARAYAQAHAVSDLETSSSAS